MRPANTTSSGTEVWQWNSPIPYLFGSLALALALITVALFVLACSYRKRAFNSSDDAEDRKPVKIMDTKAANMDDKPKVILCKTARVWIEVDTTEEMPTKIHVLEPDGNLYWQQAIYEWKPQVCSICKVFGHMALIDAPEPLRPGLPKSRRIGKDTTVQNDRVVGNKLVTSVAQNPDGGEGKRKDIGEPVDTTTSNSFGTLATLGDSEVVLETPVIVFSMMREVQNHIKEKSKAKGIQVGIRRTGTAKGILSTAAGLLIINLLNDFPRLLEYKGPK
ncbi:hypothetical protein F0562_004285 [Nyssa sinensis]|uniref:Uncharacterized protein n=1 Tax=Nyssa sinensis TaxID=561372 RepID=A0A5J5BYY3_9ASTE|nr:hypothetical protein F0562_004285 [Nyssa sinensis]